MDGADEEYHGVLEQLVANAEQEREQQREQQRELLEECLTREERARRSRDTGRPASPSAGPTFAAGNQVLHDLLGEAVVRKLPRADDPEGKINIEWARPESGGGPE